MSQKNDDFYFSRLTQSFGTAIARLIDARRNRFTRLTSLGYLPGSTAHLVTLLTPLATTTLFSAAVATATTLVLTDDLVVLGVTVADGDYVCVQYPDGITTFQTTAASYVAGTKTLTIHAVVPTGGFPAGTTVWYLGAAADHTASSFNTVASVFYSRFADIHTGIWSTANKYEPMIVYSANATVAGSLEYAGGIYAQR